MRLVILVAFLAFGFLANKGLYALADYVGFWWFVGVGAPLVAAVAIGGITYDRALQRRS